MAGEAKRLPPSSSGRWIRYTVAAEEEGRTVEEILLASMEVSRRMIQRLTRSRGLTLNHRPAFLRRAVKPGDVIAVRIAGRERESINPVSIDLSIVFEDSDLLVVDKPAGLLVHPTSAVHHRTLAHGVAHHFRASGVETPVRPVHRLDRDTSGLVIIAKTSYAHQHLDRQLREGELTREYLAVAQGIIEEEGGAISAPIGASAKAAHLRAVRPDGQPALTHFTVVQRLTLATVVAVRLETGRTHQIRVHFAHIGHPLIGDTQYGAHRNALLPRYALHSFKTSFRHPLTGESMELQARLPDDLQTLIVNG